MTDTRLPERWLTDRRILVLSDAAYRLHVTSLLWTVSNRTDGQIDSQDLVLMPGPNPSAADELVAAGLWVAFSTGWLIADWSASQTSRDELARLENMRKADREKKQRQRLRKLGTLTGDVPEDGPGDMARGTQQEGQEGQEGQAAKAGHIMEGDQNGDLDPRLVRRRQAS